LSYACVIGMINPTQSLTIFSNTQHADKLVKWHKYQLV